MSRTTVKRKDFLAKYIHGCGLTYDQACRVYACTVSILEDAVTCGTKVNIGHIGAITPRVKAPRKVKMGFKFENGVMVKAERVFFVDGKTDWSFRLYRAFRKRMEAT